MKKLKAEDPEVVNFKDELKVIYDLAGLSLKDVSTQLGELEGNVKKAANLFDGVKKAAEQGESYVTEMGVFV